ncbi:hypothetical protein NIES37_69470 (plasmid) [Tolypothrix tenuis PCC 7101]|uniref:Uncharacterized protein n=1 Tax=Tolypothrix tenuis PCC 7101 TaxID=231146 RepID=A0A1Z4NB31_9CYAN|nr:hypothetical protein NIES37_69470 [Tolypothrix tenuis PCC 7101]BAZ78143.1 hypothetical protein NIES50_67760 [Aulosira laxa NIES-50]
MFLRQAIAFVFDVQKSAVQMTKRSHNRISEAVQIFGLRAYMRK